MAVVLKCPECEDKFRWEFAEEQRWPKACPMCRAVMGNGDDDVICMPSLRGAATKANDALYREMERGSEIRAQAAAEQLGVPVSEMSGLKMTDMKDGRKPGEDYVASSIAANEAALTVGDSRPQFASPDAVGYAASVQTGPMPNAGARMRTALQQQHGERFGGNNVSDNPALETRAPGYRRRG